MDSGWVCRQGYFRLLAVLAALQQLPEIDAAPVWGIRSHFRNAATGLAMTRVLQNAYILRTTNQANLLYATR
jgi:hypothetical protein